MSALRWFGGLGAVLVASLSLTPAQDDDRPDSLIRGERTYGDSCLICHSDGVIASPRMTEAQWKAEVEKMIGWGAPVQPSEKDELTAFLIDRFVTHARPSPPETLSPDQAALADRPEPDASAEPGPGADLARGAVPVQGPVRELPRRRWPGGLIGNNLVEKPILVRPREFREVVRTGRHKMPSFRASLDASGESDLLAWLRRQGGSPSR